MNLSVQVMKPISPPIRTNKFIGFSATELSKKLGVSQPSVSISVKSGERIAKAEHLELFEGEAVVSREEASKCTWRTLRGRGPSTYARIAEIMSGKANSQQGLVVRRGGQRLIGIGTTEAGERVLVCRMRPYERRRRGGSL